MVLGLNFHVNNEIKVFNRILRKQLKVFDIASLIEVNSEWDQFTGHGIHLNSKVKRLVGQESCEHCERYFKENKGWPSYYEMEGRARDGQGEESYSIGK